MDKRIIIISVILALGGILFLGKALTGFVISQSCCFPPNCDIENLCTIHSSETPSPAGNPVGLLYFGLLMVTGSVLFYHYLHKKR